MATWIGVLWVVCALASTAAAQTPPDQPADYRREVVIRVTDRDLNPLQGVSVQVTPTWGRLLGGPPPISDADGRIRLKFRPVAENQVEKTAIRDVFWVYRLNFAYCLIKNGYLPCRDQAADRQEYARYADPLYQGLNRLPAEAPLMLTATLSAYADFLARPDGPRAEELKPLITRLYRFDEDLRLAPGSVGLNDDGVLRLGFTYEPVFDQTQMGLLAAAARLLAEPLRNTLIWLAAQDARPKGFTGYQITVKAGFQPASTPHALVRHKDVDFHLTRKAAQRVMAWLPGRPFPLAGVTAVADGRQLDLSRPFSR